jgi:hypothetical protein
MSFSNPNYLPNKIGHVFVQSHPDSTNRSFDRASTPALHSYVHETRYSSATQTFCASSDLLDLLDDPANNRATQVGYLKTSMAKSEREWPTVTPSFQSGVTSSPSFAI